MKRLQNTLQSLYSDGYVLDWDVGDFLNVYRAYLLHTRSCRMIVVTCKDFTITLSTLSRKVLKKEVVT